MSESNINELWVGGRLSHSKSILYWEDGRTEDIARGSQPWADTGPRGAQPDGDQQNRQPQNITKKILSQA
jgi:hypothetical protein